MSGSTFRKVVFTVVAFIFVFTSLAIDHAIAATIGVVSDGEDTNTSGNAMIVDLNQVLTQKLSGWTIDAVSWNGDLGYSTTGGASSSVQFAINAYNNSNLAGIPLFLVNGNHEAESASDMATLRAFYTSYPNWNLSQMPNQYSSTTNYAYDVGDIRVIAVNQYAATTSDAVNTIGRINETVFNWIKAEIKATNKQHIVVMAHEPAYPVPSQTTGNHIGDSLDADPRNRDMFVNLLASYGQINHFVGHTHISDLYEMKDFSTAEGDARNTTTVIDGGIWEIDTGAFGTKTPNHPSVGYFHSNSANWGDYTIMLVKGKGSPDWSTPEVETVTIDDLTRHILVNTWEFSGTGTTTNGLFDMKYYVDYGPAVAANPNWSSNNSGKWWEPAFNEDAAGWVGGELGVGYKTGGGAPFWLNTQIDPYGGISTTTTQVYSIMQRVDFPATSTDAYTTMTLHIDDDDGIMAWLNGTLIYNNTNTTITPPTTGNGSEYFDKLQTNTGNNWAGATLAPVFSEVDVSQYISELVDGQNTLVIWNVNAGTSLGSSDLGVAVRLSISDPYDPTPPVISNVGSSTTGITATITWTTDDLSDSQVEYGLTSSYTASSTLNSTKVTSHSVLLTGLTTNTTYHFRVISDNGSGERTYSGDYTFNTGSASAAGTVRLQHGVSGYSGAEDVHIMRQSPTTNANASTSVLIDGDAPYARGLLRWDLTETSSGIPSTASVTAAYIVYTVTNTTANAYDVYQMLRPWTESGATWNTYDGTNNWGTAGAHATSTDFNITQLGVMGPNASLAVATTTLNSRGIQVVQDWINGSVTNNGFLITRATSTDGLQFGSNSASTASTRPILVIEYTNVEVGDEDPPIISNVASSTNASSATVTWTTNEAATSKLVYGTASNTYTGSVTSGSYVTSHSRTATGLNSETLYYYRVVSADTSGNIATSSEYTFLTAAVGQSPSIVLVQEKTNRHVYSSPSTSISVTLDAAATAGNLLITGISLDKNAGTVTVPSGFTLIHGGAGSGVTGALAYKVATGGETSITWNWTASEEGTAWIGEYSGLVSSNVLDQSAENESFLSTVTASISTGTTGATTQANELAFAFFAADSSNSVGSSRSWTNGFTTINELPVPSNSGAPFLNVASKILNTTGTVETTISHAGSDESYAVIATFKAAAADSTPPVISSVASSTTGSTATITWTTDEAASSQVEYGLTSTYTASSSLNSNATTSHSITLTDLTPSTTYHFRVISIDASSNRTNSSNYTFTTTNGVQVILREGENSYAGMTDTTLDNTLPTTNLGATTTLYVDGTTPYANILMKWDLSSIPQGSVIESAALVYNITDNSGSNTYNLYRSLRPWSESQATWDEYSTGNAWGTAGSLNSTSDYNSTVLGTLGRSTAGMATTTLNSSGIAAIQGWVDGTYTNNGFFINNASSTNGLDFSSSEFGSVAERPALVISYVPSGPDTTAPIISNIASTTGTSTATITWTTNENATSTVNYGTTQSYGSASSSATLTTSHSINLSGLSSGTLYHYRITVWDAANNQATSTNLTFLTQTPDTNAPVISNVASTTSFTTATITWTTNEAATSKVSYGTASGNYTTSSTSASYVSSHSLSLAGLSQSTTYYYVVVSTDASGNTATSSEYTFLTQTADVTAPVISNLDSSATMYTATITWTTDEAASSQVEYGLTSSYTASSSLNSFATTSHRIILHGLTPNTTYNFRAISIDSSDNRRNSNNFTFTTTNKIIATTTLQEGVNNYSAMTDTQIQVDTPTTNYGTDTLLKVDGDGSQHTAFMKWGDLTSIPSGATIEAVYLAYNIKNESDEFYKIYQSKRPWVENEATWNIFATGNNWGTAGAQHTTTDRGNVSFGNMGNGQSAYVGFATTTLNGEGIQMVRDWRSGTVTNNGFQVQTFDANTNSLQWASSEATTASERPALIVVYSSDDTTPPVISSVASSTGTSTATITWSTNEAATSRVDFGLSTNYSFASSSATAVTSHSISLSGLSHSTTYNYRINVWDAAGNLATSSNFTFRTAAASTNVTVTFRDGENGYTGTRDTYISANTGQTTTNFGTATTVYADGSPDVTALMKWDVSSIPSSATLSSVSIVYNSTTAGAAFPIYESRRAWVEEQATNVIWSTGNNWGTAGAQNTTSDRFNTSLGSIGNGPVGMATTTLNSSGLAVVQAWVTGSATNNGFVIQNTANGASDSIWSSSENSTVSLRPALVVTFSTTAANDTTAPIISSVGSSTTHAAATVTWTTNENATSKVSYGTASGNYTLATTSSFLNTSHSVGLTGLSAETRYYFVVVSTDLAGNTSTSSEFSLLTSAAPIQTNPTISSAANQIFTAGATQSFGTITVTDHATPSITAANGLRIGLATSTLNARWLTSATTLTFGGTAAAKVSNPVSYTNNGSVVVIPVTTNFASNDTLTISGLSLTDINASLAPTDALVRAYIHGASDVASDASDNRTIAVRGTIARNNHSAGQTSNLFTNGSLTGGAVYAFRLVPTYESSTIANVTLDLGSIIGISSSDITNVKLYADNNSNRTFDAGDTQVGGSGSVSISGSTGTITFSSSFTSTTTKDYIVVTDIASLSNGDELTISLNKTHTTTGITSSASITMSGSVTNARHFRGGSRGGGGTQPSSESPAPSGDGIRGGGGAGGGGESGSSTSTTTPSGGGGSSGGGEVYVPRLNKVLALATMLLLPFAKTVFAGF